jgi:hypothetical protein
MCTDVERVQSNRGANTVYGGGGNPRAPPPPKSNEGMAHVGFSVRADGGEFAVGNVTADSTADQKGLQQGDRISAIDGKKLQGMHEEEVKGGSHVKSRNCSRCLFLIAQYLVVCYAYYKVFSWILTEIILVHVFTYRSNKCSLVSPSVR